MTKITIIVSGNEISCTWGDVKVTAHDEVWKIGMASLGTGWNSAEFDNVKIVKVPAL